MEIKTSRRKNETDISKLTDNLGKFSTVWVFSHINWTEIFLASPEKEIVKKEGFQKKSKTLNNSTLLLSKQN